MFFRPWILWPGLGSTAATVMAGLSSFNFLTSPMAVPEVPRAATTWVTAPPVDS